MNKELLKKIKQTGNQYFFKEASLAYLKYEIFNKKFYKNIDLIGIKKQSTSDIENFIDELRGIEQVYINESSSDIYYKGRSIGCTYCTYGKGCTVVLSYKCHRDCFFCYEETPLDPKVKIDPYNKIDMNNIYHTINESLKYDYNKTLAITGGEPFLFTDKVYEILDYVNKNFKDKHTRIYTTGDLLNEEKLIKLKELNLDEVRYSIKPGERPNIKLYKLSKKYIKTVMIEMPVQPNSYDYMVDIMSEIDNSGSIDGINLNELTFNNLNTNKYIENGYKLDLSYSKKENYFRYYDVSKIEIGVYNSKLTCLKLLKHFAEKKSSFFIHYCDLNTVSNHQYIRKRESANSLGLLFNFVNHYGVNSFLRVVGDTYIIKEILSNNNIYNFKEYNSYVDLSIDYKLLFHKVGFNLFKVYYDYTNNKLLYVEYLN